MSGLPLTAQRRHGLLLSWAEIRLRRCFVKGVEGEGREVTNEPITA